MSLLINIDNKNVVSGNNSSSVSKNTVKRSRHKKSRNKKAHQSKNSRNKVNSLGSQVIKSDMMEIKKILGQTGINTSDLETFLFKITCKARGKRTDIEKEITEDMKEFNSKFEGSKSFNEKMKQFFLFRVACAIRDKARIYAPVETGFMRDNIEVVSFEGTYAVVSFAEYSIFPHEIMENRHKVGRAKFLEDSALEVYNYLGGKLDIGIQFQPVLLVTVGGMGGSAEDIADYM